MGDSQKKFFIRNILFGICFHLLVVAFGEPVFASGCLPTPWDEIGPYYRPNPPVRNIIGTGYVLSGTVRSTVGCRPLGNVRIEIWQAGPDGEYADQYRATIFSDQAGRYRLQTSVPPPYGRRPPHIHILVDVKGFEGLVTQHYPKKGKKSATFDLVLEPEKPKKQDSLKLLKR